MASDILTGVRVVELGEGIAVPYCGKLLADFGAEVVKIESPGSGDSTRQHGPFPGDIPHPERSGLFLALNTNKLGITLHLELPTGRQLLGELLRQADVFIHDTAPRHLATRHLTSAELRREYPRLIVTALTAYGHSGPYCDYQDADITVCALGGLSDGLGEENRPPLTAPFSQGGYQAGLSAAGAIALALLVRESSGQGQVIDIAAADVLATLQTGVYLNNFFLDGSRSMRGARFGSRTIYPASFFRCSDGFMWVTAPQWAQWERLLAMVGRPDLADDERFQNRYDLAAAPPPELEVPLAQWFMEHTRDEIFASLSCPSLADYTGIHHCRVGRSSPACGAWFYHGRGAAGPRHTTAAWFAMHLSKTPWRMRRPAPLLGEHNAQIYCQELGYPQSALSALRHAGVI